MITLTSGTAFIMWLGEQITERGIGNGYPSSYLPELLHGFPMHNQYGQAHTGRRAFDIFCYLPCCDDGGCYWSNNIYGERTEKDSCTICKEGCGSESIWWPVNTSPTQNKYFRGYSADICIFYYYVSGNSCRFYCNTHGYRRLPDSFLRGQSFILLFMSG